MKDSMLWRVSNSKVKKPFALQEPENLHQRWVLLISRNLLRNAYSLQQQDYGSAVKRGCALSSGNFKSEIKNSLNIY
jgi:hypothetical protein